MTLGQIINQYRFEHGYSMEEFSKKSGISRAYISLLERDRHPDTGEHIQPSVDIINKAAIAMNLTFNELFSRLDNDGPLDISNDAIINTTNKTNRKYGITGGVLQKNPNSEAGQEPLNLKINIKNQEQQNEAEIKSYRLKINNNPVKEPDSDTNKLAQEEKDYLISFLAKLDVSQLQKVSNYINMLIDLKQ